MNDKKYSKFRGHFHYTGEYGGTIHGTHSLIYSVPKKFL